MSALTRFPGKPTALGIVEVFDEAAPLIDDTVKIPVTEATIQACILETVERLFTLYYMKHTSVCHTLVFFKSSITIPEAVEFAKRYCVQDLNARFVRIEPAIHIIE